MQPETICYYRAKGPVRKDTLRVIQQADRSEYPCHGYRRRVQFAITKAGLKPRTRFYWISPFLPAGINLSPSKRVLWVKLSTDSISAWPDCNLFPQPGPASRIKGLIGKHGSDKKQTTPYLLSKIKGAVCFPGSEDRSSFL